MITSAKRVETIPESGTEIFIPLNKLKKSPKNARKAPHSEGAVEAYAPAERMVDMKKADMAETAEQLLAATGWVLSLLRTAKPEDRAAAPNEARRRCIFVGGGVTAEPGPRERPRPVRKSLAARLTGARPICARRRPLHGSPATVKTSITLTYVVLCRQTDGCSCSSISSKR
ncbi:hypothetical protein JQ614_35755 [Bradyrhizobium diazoefficiens]|uniref:hypothetical protein n=1 Tax=Bradyrhizobium diazoefficiens TaxID=1355477 RepID=UPI001B8CFF16|nr:hypothetical protein [Bradyrhizobium diazoefficiens]MBR0866806.1 hypothetical protein [Bradyrhizobium diazoefficiens]MBR0891245.1 hypothetical protein [Bradyrhizobium diazoefficiens]MBR0923244.1 hypothetical protein [Bradyrhizobium diazoefficiens]